MAGVEQITATAEENVLVQLEHLHTLPAIAARLGRGEVTLHGWMYKIETGQVFSYDAQAGQFVPIVASEADADRSLLARNRGPAARRSPVGVAEYPI